MILCFKFLFNILWIVNKQNNFNLVNLIDLSEYINDLEEATNEIYELLNRAYISSVCDIGKILFRLLPKLEEHTILLDDFIKLLINIEFDLNIKFFEKKLLLKKDDKKINELIFENFKKSLLLANEILFLYKKNSAVKCDITEKLKNIDEAQLIFSALSHYLEIEVIEKKTFFDADLVMRELQKCRFILRDAIKYVEFVALQFDYDECE